MVLAETRKDHAKGRRKALRRRSIGGCFVGERTVCPAQAALDHAQRDPEDLGRAAYGKFGGREEAVCQR